MDEQTIQRLMDDPALSDETRWWRMGMIPPLVGEFNHQAVKDLRAARAHWPVDWAYQWWKVGIFPPPHEGDPSDTLTIFEIKQARNRLERSETPNPCDWWKALGMEVPACGAPDPRTLAFITQARRNYQRHRKAGITPGPEPTFDQIAAGFGWNQEEKEAHRQEWEALGGE